MQNKAPFCKPFPVHSSCPVPSVFKIASFPTVAEIAPEGGVEQRKREEYHHEKNPQPEKQRIDWFVVLESHEKQYHEQGLGPGDRKGQRYVERTHIDLRHEGRQGGQRHQGGDGGV